MSYAANQVNRGVRGTRHGAGESWEHTVSVRLLRAVADVLLRRGISPEALLGDDTALLYTESLESRLPLSEYQRLFARAIDLAGEPALGLLCGLQAAESAFGLVSPLISHAPTLRHAIELVIRFHPLLLEGARLQLSERMGTATLRAQFPRVNANADRSLAEMVVAGLDRTLRTFGCAALEVHAVHFEHVRPAHHAAYSEAFRGLERFASGFTGVEFASHVLDRPHIHSNAELELLLCTQAERTLERIGQPASATEQVRSIIQRRGQRGLLGMNDAALELGCSVRSLRRRLAEEGTSFRALQQEALQAFAYAMLRDSKLTLQSIAHSLGFANVAAFHRAFKRWTPLTPTEYRRTAVRSGASNAADAHERRERREQ